MSDYIIKIIPIDPFYQMDQQHIKQTLDWIRKHISADYIISSNSIKPIFVDCGGNLEHIICPVCSNHISFDWWGKEMEKLYRDGGFDNLIIKTPCCQNNISLNDLLYECTCGFSCVEFDIYNPTEEIDSLFLELLKAQMNIDVKVVKARI